MGCILIYSLVLREFSPNYLDTDKNYYLFQTSFYNGNKSPTYA